MTDLWQQHAHVIRALRVQHQALMSEAEQLRAENAQLRVIVKAATLPDAPEPKILDEDTVVDFMIDDVEGLKLIVRRRQE